MRLRSALLIAGAIVTACAIAPAVADITYTQGSGTTIFDFTCFTTKHCSAHTPINSAGTEIFTSSAPGQVTGANGTFPATQSGTWNITNISGTVSLPTGAATAAKQPALGTAGSASTDVLTVQGIASMTPLLATLSGTNNINNISGTISLPTGAATAANQTTANTSLATIASNTGAAIPAGTAYIGQASQDPSQGGAAPAFKFLALPATTTTEIVPLSGSTVTYVTSLMVFAGGTVNVTFKYGTGTNCGTGTTTLAGPYPLTAQAGFSQGSGTGAVMIVPAGKALCITTDASVGGGVHLTEQQK